MVLLALVLLVNRSIPNRREVLTFAFTRSCLGLTGLRDLSVEDNDGAIFAVRNGNGGFRGHDEVVVVGVGKEKLESVGSW